MGPTRGLRQGSVALLLANGCTRSPPPLRAVPNCHPHLPRLSPVVTDIPGLALPAGSTPSLWMLHWLRQLSIFLLLLK